VLKAQEILEEKYNVAVDVWSVTSYKELYKNATDTERYNLLNPSSTPRKSHLEAILEHEEGIFVAASDYVKALPCSISKWIPTPFVTLGTDGFGRSDTRVDLRNFFEVDARYIVYGALAGLLWKGELAAEIVTQARKDLDLDPDKLNPIDC
jgi:pyruvate dehydrogenase E1 component